VTKGTRPIVKALSIRSKPCGMKKFHTWKPTGNILPPSLTATVRPTAAPLLSSSQCIPQRSHHFEPTMSQELPVPAIAHDLLVPRQERSYRACRLRRAACCPSRNSLSNFPSTSFLPSTPCRSISSPLSPFQTYGIEVIAHTHTPDSHISCFCSCEMRHALERFDIESRTPVKSFVASTPCASPLSRLSLLHVCGAEIISHAHWDPDSYATHSNVSCFRGCDLREVLERSFIELDHATMLYC
jgi:hypothetical protein